MATMANQVLVKSSLDYCSHMLDKELSVHLPVIPAICIILILSSLERRRTRVDVCKGWFGIVVPMDFLDGSGHRWSYVAAFVAVASSLLKMLLRLFSFSFPTWAKVFMIYLQGLEVAVLAFPLFVCICTPFRLVGSICGVLYALMTFGIVTASHVMNICITLERVSTGSNEMNTALIAGLVLKALPEVASLLFLFGLFLKNLVHCFITKRFVKSEEKQNNDQEKTHIKLLLRKLPGGSAADQNWKFWQYRSMPGFLYPNRLLCIVMFVGIVLWQTICELHVSAMPSVHQKRDKLDTTCSVEEPLCTYILLLAKILDVFTVSTYLTSVIALVVVITNLLLFLRCYRYNMFKMFKGDKSFIITESRSSQKYMAQNMRFMGYFIAYNIWGFIIVYTVLLVLCMINGFVLTSLAESGRLGELFLKILEIFIYPLTALLLFYIQVFLAKHFLLQKRIHSSDPHPPLAVDNRKFFSALSYYLVFVNVAVGFISSLTRTATSFILALFQIGRLDKNLFLSGWHGQDRGYAAYIAMLQVDYSHNHPILRVFCSMLWENVQQERDRPTRVTSPGVYANIDNMEEYENTGGGHHNRHVRVRTYREKRDVTKQRIRNRWYLAFTLVRNPTLTPLRRPQPPLPEKNNIAIINQPDSQSVKSFCRRMVPLVFYKISVASPLIVTSLLIVIPLLSLSLL